MKKIIFAVTALFISASAFAAPISFKGFYVGMPMSEFLEVNTSDFRWDSQSGRPSCGDPYVLLRDGYDTTRVTWCNIQANSMSTPTEIAPNVYAEPRFYFLDNKLARITIFIASEDFATWNKLLSAKFGKPISSNSTVQNGLGLTFSQTDALFSGSDNTYALLSKRGPSITTGVIYFTSNAYAKELEKTKRKGNGI